MQTAVPFVEGDEQVIQQFADENNGIELIIYANFDLSGIAKEFKIADFERAVKHRHMLQIADAIISKTLYDTTITVVKPAVQGQPYEVIDGQHRLTAMMQLRKIGALKTYSFVVRVLHAEDARLAYRRLNSGKPLSIYDIFKSYDDGKVLFFNGLRDYCAHYKSTHKIAFGAVAYASNYASTESKHGYIVSREIVMQNAIKLNGWEVRKIEMFMYLIKQACKNEIKSSLPIFRPVIFWNLLKLYKKNLPSSKGTHMDVFRARFMALVQVAAKDAELRRIAKPGKSADGLLEAYGRLSALWGETLLPSGVACTP